MKKLFFIVVICIAASSLLIAGCGANKTESSRAAITEAKTLATAQEKVDYLVGQAKAFYNSQEFQGTVDPHTPIAQGWLRASHRKLDPELSRPYRPYHSHDDKMPLKPRQIVELDIEKVT